MDLCFLSMAAWRFASSLRSRLAAVGRVGLRGGETCWSSCRRSAIRSKATSRLACCDLRSVAVTLIPLGRWVNRTPVSTLLRCCPPGPLAMKNSRSQSRSRESRSVGYSSGKIFSLVSLANGQLPQHVCGGLVSGLHRNSVYLERRAALASSLDTSGRTDKTPVLIQSWHEDPAV